MLRALRQPRYAAFTVLMVIVAAACCLAGTWQISRFLGKHAANDELRANAHGAPVPVASVLPLVGAPNPAKDAIEFKQVTATGVYDVAHQSVVRHRSASGGDTSDDGTGTSPTGYLVLTPLRTAAGTLLIVRGFVADTGAPPQPAAPPAGTVTVTARLEQGESPSDRGASLPDGEVETINPGDQQARLGTPVFDGFAELDPNQPGTAGLVSISGPDLSNPAGGAVEPQHLAYVVQWYLFALLALAAPLAMARSESTHRPGDDDAVPVAADETPVEPPPAAQDDRDPLADRYGRPRRTRLSSRRAL